MASQLQKKKRKENQTEQRLVLSPDELKRLVEKSVSQKLHQIEVHSEYSGPMPLPEHCRVYEELLPGFTDRALKLAEKQQEDQTSALKRRDNLLFISRFAGQIIAGGLTTLFICGGVFLFYHDKDAAAWTTMMGGMAMIVSAFVIRGRKQSPED